MIMRTIISCADDYYVVAISANKYCFVTGRIPNQAIYDEFISVMDTGEGKSRMVSANTDLIMVVKHLHPSGNGCKDILFIRENRHKDNMLQFLGYCPITEEDLKKIIPILDNDKSSIRYQALEGFSCAIVYLDDEIGIPNINGRSGTTLWIISKTKYAKLMNPPITDTTEAKEIAKKALVVYTAAKKALLAEAAAKKKIADAAKKLADTAEKKAITAQINVRKAIQKAFDARATANVASEAAVDAIFAYTEAAAKVTA